MPFDELALEPSLLKAVAALALTEPTPVQRSAVPVLLEGKDAYICSETGSGKTLAYLLPLYSKLLVDKAATQVVVLAPTHELALQIHRVSCDVAQAAGLAVRNVLLLGGTSLDRQIEKLKKKPQIVIGSPGRTMELIERGKLKVNEVKTVVIDEADRLMVGESLTVLKKIIKACPGKRQLVFVSATEQPESMSEITALSPGLVRLQVAEVPINPNLDHYYLSVEERDKPDVIRKLIHATGTERAIAFTHRNETAEIVAAKLNFHKIPVADLHGAFKKEERKKAMQDFQSGAARVLIASDVAARGLDISGVTHIFNLDIPSKSKDYVHRVGRAARAGAKGVAISLVVGAERHVIRRLRSELGISIPEVVLRGGEMLVVGRESDQEPG